MYYGANLRAKFDVVESGRPREPSYLPGRDAGQIMKWPLPWEGDGLALCRTYRDMHQKMYCPPSYFKRWILLASPPYKHLLGRMRGSLPSRVAHGRREHFCMRQRPLTHAYSSRIRASAMSRP